VVTGGSAGLGLAIASAFLSAGYDVAIIGRDTARLDQAVERLTATADAHGRRLRSIQADVTDECSVSECFDSIGLLWKRIDVLVNCVGASDRGRVEDLTRLRLLELIDTNVTSTLLCSQAALPWLCRSGGAVVNIGSLSCKLGARYLGAYSAAKHALAGLTQQMRLEWVEYGVHVALLNPGPIRRPDAGRRYGAQGVNLPESARMPAGGAKLKGLPAERVAAAVVRCARRRDPDMILPRRVRMLVVISHVFPRLGDWLLLKFTGNRASTDQNPAPLEA